MFGIGAQELILILVVALLVFGPKRLPELARTMGKGLAEFRRASSDLRHSLQTEIDRDPDTPAPAPRVSEGDDRPAMAGDTGPAPAKTAATAGASQSSDDHASTSEDDEAQDGTSQVKA